MKLQKIITFVIIVAFTWNYSSAADSTKAYVNPFVQFVPKTGQTAIAPGINAAYSPVHKLFVGISYQGVVNSFMPLTEDDTRKEFTSSWGGLIVDYQIFDREVYSMYANLGLGMGLIDIVIDELGALPEESETYQYIQLGAMFDVPINRNLSFTMGLQYRMVSDINYKNVSSSDISGASGVLGIRYIFLK